MRSRLIGIMALTAVGAFAVVASPAVAVGASTSGGSVTALSRPAVIEAAAHATAAQAGTRGSRLNPSRVTPSERRVFGGRSVIGTDERTQVTKTTKFPSRAIGQIEEMQDGLGYICTGWLIDHNTILTAGHCAYDPSAGPNDLIESATFSPGRNGATDPYGSCNVVQAYAPTQWAVSGNPNHDWSLMQLDCTIGDTVGWIGLQAKKAVHAFDGVNARVQGYPGDKTFGTMWQMTGPIANSTKSMVFYQMDTFGGESGSPVFQQKGKACAGGPCGFAIHTYGVGLPGPGATNNAGTRITQARLNTILSLAGLN